jgi:RimJ/RimL family protein N-acetyltransferase
MRVEALRHLPIETERLRLRALSLDDLDGVARVLTDPEAMRYFPRAFTRDEARGWIERSLGRYASEGTGLFAVERRADAAFLGDTGLVVQRPGGVEDLEVGYHFARDQWGQGYATEAARACVQLALGPLGVQRVVAMVRPENAPSQRVARRLGMRVEKQIVHAGMVHDLYVLEA